MKLLCLITLLLVCRQSYGAGKSIHTMDNDLCSLRATGSLLLVHDSLQRKMFALLSYLIGNWEVKSESRLSLNGPWETTRGTSVILYALDSALIEEEYDGARQGKPFRSKTFFAVNSLNHKYQRTFIDAPHGILILFEGVEENGDLYFDKEIIHSNGNSILLRVVYHKDDDDHFSLESMRKPQGAEEWDTTGRMKYIRVP